MNKETRTRKEKSVLLKSVLLMYVTEHKVHFSPNNTQYILYELE